MYAKIMTELVTRELVKRGCYSKNVVPAIVAQAIVESKNGTSNLSCTYHNHFGMKCGNYWKGNSVTLKTKEEINGKIIEISDNFRVYRCDADGVAGFFDFIATRRYRNLQNCTTPKEWLETIKNDGYCTSSNYVESCMNYVNVLLTQNYTDTRSLPTYKKGRTYTLQANMNVRHMPLSSSSLVGYNGLTKDGKKHDRDKNSSLEKGTVVTCKDVYYYSDEVWLRIPSGWICGYDENNVYVK